jgi:hypothetical protein
MAHTYVGQDPLRLYILKCNGSMHSANTWITMQSVKTWELPSGASIDLARYFRLN